jgi:hypothetical protein
MKLSSSTIIILAPLITFFASYLALYWYIQTPSFTTPSLIGLSVTEGSQILGHHLVGIQVIRTKIDADVPHGTIINQYPTPGQRIKAHLTAPALMGLHKDLVETEMNRLGISATYYELDSPLPAHTIIAQIPQHGQPIENKKMICYVSKPSDKQLIFPDLKKRSVAEVQEFCAYHNYSCDVYHPDQQEASHVCNECIVVDQRPLAGSLVDTRKPLSVQISVQRDTDS